MLLGPVRVIENVRKEALCFEEGSGNGALELERSCNRTDLVAGRQRPERHAQVQVQVR